MTTPPSANTCHIAILPIVHHPHSPLPRRDNPRGCPPNPRHQPSPPHPTHPPLVIPAKAGIHSNQSPPSTIFPTTQPPPPSPRRGNPRGCPPNPRLQPSPLSPTQPPPSFLRRQEPSKRVAARPSMPTNPRPQSSSPPKPPPPPLTPPPRCPKLNRNRT